MKVVVYIRQELGITLPEWAALSDKDKADFKAKAAEEMKQKGIEVTE